EVGSGPWFGILPGSIPRASPEPGFEAGPRPADGQLSMCSIATTLAAHGQNWSNVKLPSSIIDGVPSHTSVVMSAQVSVVGSMCQAHGAFTPGSPRTMSPFGIDPSGLPARSACVCARFSGPSSSIRNLSPTTSNSATGLAEIGGAADGSGVPGGWGAQFQAKNG